MTPPEGKQKPPGQSARGLREHRRCSRWLCKKTNRRRHVRPERGIQRVAGSVLLLGVGVISEGEGAARRRSLRERLRVDVVYIHQDGSFAHREIRLRAKTADYLAALLNPSLTAIAQPAFEMGREAAATLVNLVEKKESRFRPQRTEIKSRLIVRNSTK